MALRTVRRTPRKAAVKQQRGRRRSATALDQMLNADSLVAAAQSLDQRQHNTGLEEGWQRQVWDLYDAVPELRTAARITAQSMSQCRLILARVSDDGEPVPLDYGTEDDPGPDADHPARVLMGSFAGGAGGQAELLDSIGTYLTTTGDCVLVGSFDPNKNLTDPVGRFQAYSKSQVTSRSNNNIILKLDEVGGEIEVSEENDLTSIRVWRPHPRYKWQADSAGRAALTVMTEIVGYDSHLRAALLSRLASAGLLLVPEGLTLPGQPSEDDGDNPNDPFINLLMKVAGIAIKDRESAAALIPLMIRGEGEELDHLRLVDFWTDFNDKVVELRTNAISRMAVSVDMNPEQLTGLGQTQHWTGSLITDSWVQTYLASVMTLTCASLTTGWLYPAMERQAKATGQTIPFADIIVWYDASSLRTRPNQGAEAVLLYDRGDRTGYPAPLQRL